MPFMISGNKLHNNLYISVASIWRFLSWTVTDLPLERSYLKMRNDLYRQLLMPSHEAYYDLSVCYELSRSVNNIQIMNNAFMVILSFFWVMHFDILARVCIFCLIFSTIFKKWSSNLHLWSKSMPNNSSCVELASWFSQHLYTGHCQTLLKDEIFCY